MEEYSFIERFKWIGIAFFLLFPFLFLGGIHVGPLSVRMIVSYGLLFYVLWRGSSDYLPNKAMRMYFAYLLVYIFINIVNLTAFDITFIKQLVAEHFVCCIAIFAFPRVFKTEQSLWAVYVFLVFSFLLDAGVTILQAFNIPLGWIIGMSINPLEIEEMATMQSELGDVEDFQKSFIMGIMGRSVGNGYFIATMLPVVTYHVWDKFRLKTLWAFFMFAIAGICIYFIQQRMATIVAAAYILAIVFLKRTSILTRLFSVVAIIILFAIYGESLFDFDYSQLGRLFDYNDELRGSTLDVLGEFASEPGRFLLGNNQITNAEERQVFLVLGHNTFTDTFRMGGIFLLITFLILFYHLCKSLIEVFIFSYHEEDFRTMGMAIGCFCFLLYSQTHSTGVQSASIMFWTLYTITIQCYRVKCEEIEGTTEGEEQDEDLVESY